MFDKGHEIEHCSAAHQIHDPIRRFYRDPFELQTNLRDWPSHHVTHVMVESFQVRLGLLREGEVFLTICFQHEFHSQPVWDVSFLL